jgi:hypothetical protein
MSSAETHGKKRQNSCAICAPLNAQILLNRHVKAKQFQIARVIPKRRAAKTLCTM